MAIQQGDLAEYLNEERLRYTVMEDHLRLSFSTDYYQSPDGEKSVFLVLKLEEEGEYFKLIAPNLYRQEPGSLNPAVFQTLLQVSWKTKLVQFEYDDSDGEIRAVIEFPIEDGTLTRRQLMRCLNGMVQIVEEYHPVIEDALRDGVVDFLLEDEYQLQKSSREVLSLLRARKAQSAAKPQALKLEE
jgi:hypothetical protein